MLNLRAYRGRSRIVHYRQFLGRRPRIDPAAPTVVTDATATTVWNGIIVDIVNN